MLNYTTTTIVNTAASIHGNATTKVFRVDFGPELKNNGTTHKLCLAGIAKYMPAKKATATIASINTLTAGEIYRIAMYIRLRNNNNEYFSNQWTFHGKPFFIEFKGGETAAQIASRVKKLMLAQFGYNIFDVAASGNNLVITAHDQWEMFVDQDNHPGVKLEQLFVVDTAGKPVTGTTTLPTHEEFQDATPVSGVTVTIDNGNEAFGDFAHIVKDLRLPTAANLRWQGIAQGDVFGDEPNDDKPLPTGKYTQYTLQFDAERGIGQQTVLGGVGTSRTVHVFYVESAATSTFEAELAKVGVVVATDASTGIDIDGESGDDVLLNPAL